MQEKAEQGECEPEKGSLLGTNTLTESSICRMG